MQEPGLIQTTRFWGVGYALSLVNERYIFRLKRATDARGAAQLVARRAQDGKYLLSLVYNPSRNKAPGKLREDVIDAGLSLDEAIDFMSAFERIGRDHDKHIPMPDEHAAANAAIGKTHILDVANYVRETRLEEASRPTQAKRLRRYRPQLQPKA